MCILEEMDKEFKNFKPTKAKKSDYLKDTESTNSISAWIKQKEASCFICSSVDKTFQAYMKTFFTMYKKMRHFENKLQIQKAFAFLIFCFVRCRRHLFKRGIARLLSSSPSTYEK